MSALAHYYHLRGYRVSGYDRTPSVVTDALEKEGITIYFDTDESQLDGVDSVIYTPAIKDDNALYQAIVRRGIPMQKRSQALGEISKAYKTIAVAGTHGKTSTSTLVAVLLRAAGVDCTAFLGGISNDLGSNFVYGQSEWVVVEADEFDRSFLTLWPEMAIINSVDPDHLDIYGDHEAMLDGYRQFAAQVKGDLFVHESIKDIGWGREVKVFGENSQTTDDRQQRTDNREQTTGGNSLGSRQADDVTLSRPLGPSSKGDITISNISFQNVSTHFSYSDTELGVENQVFELRFPGRHNVLNAAAATAVTLRVAGAGEAALAGIGNAMRDFQGIYRRYDIHLNTPAIAYVDDYAHHPTEIHAAIAATRGLFPDRQLIAVFQPHLFTRTRDFYQGFGEELAQADEVILLPIYPAREQPLPGITTEIILDVIDDLPADAPVQGCRLVEKADLIETLRGIIRPPSVLLTVGAGDIDREVEKVVALAREWV